MDEPARVRRKKLCDVGTRKLWVQIPPQPQSPQGDLGSEGKGKFSGVKYEYIFHMTTFIFIQNSNFAMFHLQIQWTLPRKQPLWSAFMLFQFCFPDQPQLFLNQPQAHLWNSPAQHDDRNNNHGQKGMLRAQTDLGQPKVGKCPKQASPTCSWGPGRHDSTKGEEKNRRKHLFFLVLPIIS